MVREFQVLGEPADFDEHSLEEPARPKSVREIIKPFKHKSFNLYNDNPKQDLSFRYLGINNKNKAVDGKKKRR